MTIPRPRPQQFTAFVDALGQVEMTPAQRVKYGVACDGSDPMALEGEARSLALRIFGGISAPIPQLAREVFVDVKGARVGGTMFGALRCVHLGCTISLETLGAGEVAFVLFVGPDMRLPRQALAYARAAARAAGACVEAEALDGFTLRRADGRSVRFECLPASRGGSAIRGRSLVAVLFTEFAFFRDDDFVINDVELFKAVAPRILFGGQILIESTPWAEQGLLFDLFKANFGNPKTALVAHSPTLLMRPDDRTNGLVERERQRDPDNALREFGGEFMSAGTGLFFDPSMIDACVDSSLSVLAS